MEISFANKRLERQLSNEAEVRRAFGERAQRLMMRLDLLSAASCLADVPHTPPTRRHALSGKRSGHYAVDITANWRLIFRPLRLSPRGDPDRVTDLTMITAIEIVGIEDYH